MAATAGFYLWRLDKAVVHRFQTKRFSVPSAVYSAPTELRPGVRVSRDDLVRLVTALDYVPTSASEPRTGEYAKIRNSLRIRTHAFQWPGGSKQESRTATIAWEGGAIAGIRDGKGRPLRTLALEPLLLGKFYGAEHETRQLVAYPEISERFVPALIAAEDNRFYTHPGVDIWGLVRAAWVNITKGGIRQGGSTLTQQLVKNLWLTPDRTFRRKFSEILMALMLERHYAKEEILETYANVVYFGQRGAVSIIGADEASRYYFGKPVSQMTWGEAALLAGLIRSPAQNSPFRNPDNARKRRDHVLNAMREMNMLDDDALARAKQEKIRTQPPPPISQRAGYFMSFVSRTLLEQHQREELQSAGLQVHTTLSAPLQLAAEHAVQNGLRYLEAQDKRLAQAGLQSALVAMHPGDGRILAYVGGREYGVSQFDRAGQARRQIGSLVKPFVYYAAVEKGYPATSTWSNDQVIIQTKQGDWIPENYDKSVGGEVSMRYALERSMNLPTVRIANTVGIAEVKRVLEAAGIESPIKPFPALALGALEATPLEVTRAYATLAAVGSRSTPQGITLITDSDGKTLRRFALETAQTLLPAPSFVIDQMLKGVVAQGTARDAARIGYQGDLAGKTGTTSDYRDAWFAGYTPSLVTVVWVGSDDNDSIRYTGSKLALPVWGEFMLSAVQWEEPLTFAQPEGVSWIDIDPASGERATYRCPSKVPEVFVTGTEPEFSCRHHQNVIESSINLFR
jgi:penicillin-binding protein 1B